MEHFLIVTNDGKDADGRVTAKVKQLLTDAGKTCVLCEKDGDKKIIREKIPEKIDCAVVIGGDGSLIEVARFLHGRNIPVLGINRSVRMRIRVLFPAPLGPSRPQIPGSRSRLTSFRAAKPPYSLLTRSTFRFTTDCAPFFLVPPTRGTGRQGPDARVPTPATPHPRAG